MEQLSLPICKLQDLLLEQLQANPDNPRQTLDDEEQRNLQGSLQVHGQWQPLLVTAHTATMYVVVDGHRRLQAAKSLGWKKLQALVLPEGSSAAHLKLMMLVLNIRRADLNVMDRSDSLAAIQQESNWNLSQLTQAVSDKLPTISKTLKLQALIPEAKDAVRAGKLGFVKAYELATLPTDQQRERFQRSSLGKSFDNETISQTVVTKRVHLPLGSGISITVAGAQLSMEDLLLSLEYVLRESRKLQKKTTGLDVTTLAKLFQDQAKGAKSC